MESGFGINYRHEWVTRPDVWRYYLYLQIAPAVAKTLAVITAPAATG